MPLYEYRCESCQVTTMEYRKVEHRDIMPKCDCGQPMKRELSRCVAGKVEKEYFHAAFGEVVKNKHHYKELQRKHGTRDVEGADYTEIQRQLKEAREPVKVTTTDKEYQELANNYGAVNS